MRWILLITLLLSPATAHAYGALASGTTPKGTDGGALAVDMATPELAAQAAMKTCKETNNSNCRVVRQFANQCIGSHFNRKTGKEFHVFANNLHEALNKAAELCRSQYQNAYYDCVPNDQSCDTKHVGVVATINKVPDGVRASPSQPSPPPTSAASISKSLETILGLAMIGGLGWFLYYVGVALFGGKTNPKQSAKYVPRPANQLSTAAETHEAKMHFQSALQQLQEAKRSLMRGVTPAQAEGVAEFDLSQAGHHAARVRALDPNITITTTDKEPTTYTIDAFTAELLYYEAWALRIAAPEVHVPAFGRVGERNNPKKMAQARQAIDKAIQYRPGSSLFYLEKAKVYSASGHDQTAFEAIEKALELDPNNLEAFQWRDDVRRSKR